jgi:hypothetical protein
MGPIDEAVQLSSWQQHVAKPACPAHVCSKSAAFITSRNMSNVSRRAHMLHDVFEHPCSAEHVITEHLPDAGLHLDEEIAAEVRHLAELLDCNAVLPIAQTAEPAASSQRWWSMLCT